MRKTVISLATLLCVASFHLPAQVDSVVFDNGDFITGSVESMDKGILAFGTDYSDKDFLSEWERIMELYTVTTFIVTLENGEKHVGTLRSSGPGQLTLIPDKGEAIEVSLDEVVNLNPISDRFMDRISANIDLGYSYTKSQRITQFSLRSFLGYETRRWNTDISFNSTQSGQEGVEPTKITEGTWNFRYNLPARLYALLTVNLLSDTEQLLDLRINSQSGLGAYLIRSNQAYWGGKLGMNRNMERYTDPGNNRDSWEGFLGTEVNLYDIGDLSFLTTAILYMGITEGGRWRSDLGFNVKYEFPHDFYVKSGFSLNWDNMPVEGAETVNLIFRAGFGWEW